MTSRPACGLVVVCSAVLLSAAMASCHGTSADLTASGIARLEERREQERLDRQRLAGLDGGLARSLQPSLYAESEEDTLANLLPGGDADFSALSAALWRDYLAADHGTAQPDVGSAYVKSVSSDGERGFFVRPSSLTAGRPWLICRHACTGAPSFAEARWAAACPRIRSGHGPTHSSRTRTIRPRPTGPTARRTSTASISMAGRRVGPRSAISGVS